MNACSWASARSIAFQRLFGNLARGEGARRVGARQLSAGEVECCDGSPGCAPATGRHVSMIALR